MLLAGFEGGELFLQRGGVGGECGEGFGVKRGDACGVEGARRRSWTAMEMRL